MKVISGNNTSSIKGNLWFKALFGIEKENIRVDMQGRIARTPHPAVFGDKLKHPYITTDFSESQVEMITPPLPSIPQALGFLETIHDIVSLELHDELLWPQSVPPVLPPDKEIPIAHYTNVGRKEEQYREALAMKYGRKKQTVSGIHFNISLNDGLLGRLHQEMAPGLSFSEFKNEAYLRMTRQLLRHRWLYVLVFGSSPVFDQSFDLRCRKFPVYFDTRNRGLSLRNSCFGYGNFEELYPDYSSVPAYHRSVERMVDQGSLTAAKELYAPVRLKFLQSKDYISYLEIRFVDINPMSKIGVTPEMLHFLHWLAIFGLVTEENDSFSPEQQSTANTNYGNVSLLGLKTDIPFLMPDKSGANAWAEARKLVLRMNDTYAQLETDSPSYQDALRYVSDMVANPGKRPVHQLLNHIDEKGFIQFHVEKAKQYLEESRQNNFSFRGLEDMELSTQLLLRESVRRGVSFDILDKGENFVRLKRDQNIQYVRQATMTSLDSYASILAMENKLVTKQILDEHGIRVPRGINYTDKSLAKADFQEFRNRPVVIKPKLTNFGLGITILKNNADQQVFERAVDIAFEHDSSVLIEEFIGGKEFRFLVMDGEVAGILHRVPANVTGDGSRTVRELVVEKNKDPLRGKGYRTPLEKIQLGEAEEMFLATQGRTFDHIPGSGEVVFLRENSNISTGGDSIDFTDEIPESYKRIAIEAARVLDVKITGLDMIIADYTEESNPHNYAIIELNFNPAIHIHCHPYRGTNRKIDEKLLDMLGYHVDEQHGSGCCKPLFAYIENCCRVS